MIEGIPILDVGQSGLLALVFVLVLTDRLVWHKRLEVLQKQIEAKDAELAEVVKQNGVLLNSAIPTVNTVLTALHQAAGEGDPP